MPIARLTALVALLCTGACAHPAATLPPARLEPLPPPAAPPPTPAPAVAPPPPPPGSPPSPQPYVAYRPAVRTTNSNTWRDCRDGEDPSSGCTRKSSSLPPFWLGPQAAGYQAPIK